MRLNNEPLFARCGYCGGTGKIANHYVLGTCPMCKRGMIEVPTINLTAHYYAPSLPNDQEQFVAWLYGGE